MTSLIKPLIIIISFQIPTFQAFTQRPISYIFTEISKALFDSCSSKVKYLVINPRITKRSGRLVIPIRDKKSKIFTDDGEFKENEYLGDIKGTYLSLVKSIGPNTEDFYLINRSAGFVDTLIGLPVFSSNMTDFACLNNPGTDEQQKIQICEIENGIIKTRDFIKSRESRIFAFVFLTDIGYVRRNSILTKDDNGKYWKLDFKN